MMDLDSPLILLGRGGSGTRLLSQLIDCDRVFIGNVLNRTGDSLEWKDVVYDLAAKALAGPPEPKAAAILRDHALEVLSRRPGGAETVWGWKLPETILILPWVLEAFPRARIAFLVRHPVPTALSSLHVTARPDHPVGRHVLAISYARRGESFLEAAVAPAHERTAVSWAFQIENALPHLAPLAREGRLLALHYEHLCADPLHAMRALDTLADLAFADRRAPDIDRSRMREFDPDDRVVRTVWEIAGATASKLGYGPASSGPIASWDPAGPHAGALAQTRSHQ